MVADRALGHPLRAAVPDLRDRRGEERGPHREARDPDRHAVVRARRAGRQRAPAPATQHVVEAQPVAPRDDEQPDEDEPVDHPRVAAQPVLLGDEDHHDHAGRRQRVGDPREQAGGPRDERCEREPPDEVACVPVLREVRHEAERPVPETAAGRAGAGGGLVGQRQERHVRVDEREPEHDPPEADRGGRQPRDASQQDAAVAEEHRRDDDPEDGVSDHRRGRQRQLHRRPRLAKRSGRSGADIVEGAQPCARSTVPTSCPDL